jgi:putative nucleotidyltransferase with HDIG domain
MALSQGARLSTIESEVKKEQERSTWVFLYTSVVTVLGIAIIVLALRDPPQDRFGVLLFAILGVIAELFSVELFVSTRGSRVSVSSVIALASVILFGPLAGALTQTFAGLITPIPALIRGEYHNGSRVAWLQRSAFNTGMWIISAAYAGGIYYILGGSSGHFSNLSSLPLPALFAAAASNVIINNAILIGVLSVQTGRKPLEIWKGDFGWSVPISILGGVFGGGALAWAYGVLGAFGVLVLFLPVLSTGYSFRLYVSNTKGYLNQLERLNRDLDKSNLGLLATLGEVIDAYDIYTYGHSTQVTVYAKALAEKMGLPQDECDTIMRAALIHDVGKVGITDTIIGKQGPLTDEEYNIVKRHPIIGAEIVSQMVGMQDIVPIVRHHHERWDGRGYPDGLEREEIPLGARILALADTLDTLCSDRPWRPTRSFKAVLHEIMRCSSTQFDPKVVNAFLELADEKGRDFFKNSAVTVDKSVILEGFEVSDQGHRYLKKSMVPENNLNEKTIEEGFIDD